MLAVRPPQVTSERASLGIDDAGVSAEGTGTSVVSVSGKVKYDLPDPIAELQDAVGLTRGTIKAILEGNFANTRTSSCLSRASAKERSTPAES